MKILTSDEFWDYVKRNMHANTYFLYINHKYDTDKRYIICKNDKKYFEKFFDTNSKEELKIWMDLMGYNILRNFLIKNYRGDKLEITYAMIELSNVS